MDQALHIPSVAVDRILSFLSWEDKLTTIKALPPWEVSLYCTDAWHHVCYTSDAEYNEYFVTDKQRHFLHCIKKYGKFMKNIQFMLVHLSPLVHKMFERFAKYCENLRHFELHQTDTECYDDPNASSYWRDHDVSVFCDILKKCKNLNHVSINKPLIQWEEGRKASILHQIIDQNLTNKIVHLNISTVRTGDHTGLLSILIDFKSLKSLEIQRQKIDQAMIMEMVKHGLQELCIVQEGEIPLEIQAEFNQAFWIRVLQICPSFKIDLSLEYIMVAKESFPAGMPLRTLQMENLVNLVTSDVMEHLVALYKETLVNFTYRNSLIENCETGDEKVTFSLVHMAQNCSNLTILEYGFPISGLSVLLIAHFCQLKELTIPEVELFFGFDWKIQPDWSNDFVFWLKENSKNYFTLCRAVSKLLEFPWRCSTC